MYAVELALRLAHIFGAVLLVGGILMQKWVVVPAAAQLTGEGADAVRESLRRRWALTVMAGSGLLLLSGLINTARISMGYRFPDGDYNLLLGVKLLLALVVMFIASVLSGRSPLAQKWRAQAGMWLNVLLLLSVLVLGLAGSMKMAKRVVKQDPPGPVNTEPANQAD